METLAFGMIDMSTNPHMHCLHRFSATSGFCNIYDSSIQKRLKFVESTINIAYLSRTSPLRANLIHAYPILQKLQARFTDIFYSKVFTFRIIDPISGNKPTDEKYKSKIKEARSDLPCTLPFSMHGQDITHVFSCFWAPPLLCCAYHFSICGLPGRPAGWIISSSQCCNFVVTSQIRFSFSSLSPSDDQFN